MTLDDLESACDKALRQIDQRMYAKDLKMSMRVTTFIAMDCVL